MDFSIVKNAEDALPNSLQIGFEPVNNSFESALFHFIETSLTEMALNGSLDDFVKQNSESWPHFSMLMH